MGTRVLLLKKVALKPGTTKTPPTLPRDPVGSVDSMDTGGESPYLISIR